MSFSDERKSYVPIIDAVFNNGQIMNPGATRLIPEDSFTANDKYTVRIQVLRAEAITINFSKQIVGPTVSSVTLLDILKFIGEKTVIVKMDTEGFECKVMKAYALNGRTSQIPQL